MNTNYGDTHIMSGIKDMTDRVFKPENSTTQQSQEIPSSSAVVKQVDTMPRPSGFLEHGNC